MHSCLLHQLLPEDLQKVLSSAPSLVPSALSARLPAASTPTSKNCLAELLISDAWNDLSAGSQIFALINVCSGMQTYLLRWRA